jgi:hypothetical protein
MNNNYNRFIYTSKHFCPERMLLNCIYFGFVQRHPICCYLTIRGDITFLLRHLQEGFQFLKYVSNADIS